MLLCFIQTFCITVQMDQSILDGNDLITQDTFIIGFRIPNKISILEDSYHASRLWIIVSNQLLTYPCPERTNGFHMNDIPALDKP